MPIFQFVPPSNLPDFILYIWHCMGKESPSIPDLRFFLSFRAKLMSPSKAQELIENALHDRLIVNKNNILQLSDTLQTRQVGQEQAEKERIQQTLVQQARKEKVLTTKTFNDYFREILPEEYKSKTFLIKLKDIQLNVPDPASEQVRGTIITEGKSIEVTIDGKRKILSHSCDFLTSQYQSARKFCPHLGAIFRSLQKNFPDLALCLLQSMVEEKTKWQYS
ncbi:MAG: hypothetical protein RBG13Loki_2855 [Promethearchaeota archaeon CR_4]|nr:MAG: hypothetical protein RBG13Loki_2855 [Candidatus Lokiarchaeota archaeon CR_4]